MERCDVLIVGGGPAGSTCARALCGSGLDVMVMDKQDFPRNKVCAGWITPAVVAALDLDLEHYRSLHTIQEIHGFRVSRLGGTVIETGRKPRPISYGIRRVEFDDYLLRRSGARLQLGQPLRSLERDAEGWIINGAIRAALVIGAGGHFCPLARHLGARVGATEIAVAAQEVEFHLTPDQQRAYAVRGEVPELFFCADLKGYGWVFRKGEYINIGLGREDRHGLSGHLREFCDHLRHSGRIPEPIADRFNGHAYLLYNHGRRRALDDGVLLIGDAAGLAYPQSGEGIRPAVESALLAARVIAAAAGDYRAQRLASYPALLQARFGVRERGPGPGRLIPGALKRALAGRLLATRWFIESTVIGRWFLHEHQEPLLSDGTG